MADELLEYKGIIISQDTVCGLPVRLYHHIFYGRVSKNFKIYGVHHREALTSNISIPEPGNIRIVDNSIEKQGNGFYKATVQCWNGKEWVSKTSKNGFFPDSWDIKQVMKELSEARQRLTIDDWMPPVLPQKKSNAYLQKTSCGQTLVFYLGKPRRNRPAILDKYIVTVFPYFENC